MDQLVSGSGLYPLRFLDNSWFSEEELKICEDLTMIGIQGAGSTTNERATAINHQLARDLLAPLVYGIDVRIVLDNSGSKHLFKNTSSSAHFCK